MEITQNMIDILRSALRRAENARDQAEGSMAVLRAEADKCERAAILARSEIGLLQEALTQIGHPPAPPQQQIVLQQPRWPTAYPPLPLPEGAGK